MPQRSLNQNFLPYGNYTVAATATSQNIVVAEPTYGTPCTDLLISNSTTSVAFVSWGTTAQTATSSSFAVLPGAIMAVDTGTTPITNIAVILATGTGNVYLSIGIGN